MSVLGMEGASRLKVILWVLVLFVVIHIGLNVAMVKIDLWRMEDEMNIKAKNAQVLKDIEISYELEKKAQDLGLPLGREHFLIVRNEEQRTIRIQTSWDVTVNYFWGVCGAPCVKTYHFEPVAQGAY